MAENRTNYQDRNQKRAPGILHEDRPQPNDLDAEKAILASMLLEPDFCIDFAIEKLGSEEAFYSPAHRALFKCIKKLHDEKKGVDLISVANILNAENKLEEIGGRIFLVELQDTIATTANIETWCGIVRDYSILRGMINVCSESLTKCFEVDTEVGQLIDKIESEILDVRYKNVKPEILDLSSYITEVFENVQKIINKEVEVGIPTGFKDLDDLVVGLKPGEMFVLAARPSIGKTSLALNIIRNVALKKGGGRPVAFFSLEMTADQITRRLLCTEAEVSESAFFDGSFKASDMSKLTRAVSTLKKAQIFVDPTGGLTISELRAKANRLKKMNKIELIVIDYLQLMKAGWKVDSRQQEVAEISSGIKKLAKDLHVPVLVLAQLNREIEKGTSAKARPKLSHLRESGAIEQDADIVTFLHRDRDDLKENEKEINKNGVEAELIVEKNRNGRIGIVHLTFRPKTMLFTLNAKHRYGDDDKPSEPEEN